MEKEGQLEKKNGEKTKQELEKALNKIFDTQIKPKVNSYETFAALKADIEKLKQECLQNLKQFGGNAKECIMEFLYQKTMQIGETLFMDKVQNKDKEMRIMQQKLELAQGDAQKAKMDLLDEKNQIMSKMQEREEERIKLKTEEAILNEKFLKAKTELDELKAKMSSEITDRVNELEMKNKILSEQLERKQFEVKEATNETLAKSSANQQQLALLE